jgi:hypothetical protein
MTNTSYASRSHPASFDAGDFMPRLMTGVIDVESYDPAQLLKDDP